MEVTLHAFKDIDKDAVSIAAIPNGDGTYSLSVFMTNNIQTLQQKIDFIDHSGTLIEAHKAQFIMSIVSKRKYLFIQNVSNAALWIRLGNIATEGPGSIKLLADEKFEMISPNIHTDIVSIIGASAGQGYTAIEGK